MFSSRELRWAHLLLIGLVSGGAAGEFNFVGPAAIFDHGGSRYVIYVDDGNVSVRRGLTKTSRFEARIREIFRVAKRSGFLDRELLEGFSDIWTHDEIGHSYFETSYEIPVETVVGPDLLAFEGKDSEDDGRELRGIITPTDAGDYEVRLHIREPLPLGMSPLGIGIDPISPIGGGHGRPLLHGDEEVQVLGKVAKGRK